MNRSQEAAGIGRGLLSLVSQLQRSEVWTLSQLQAHQNGRLTQLLRHARAESSFYAERLPHLDDEQLVTTSWSTIPILKRADLARYAEKIRCKSYPQHHGRTKEFRTSGSTGEPVCVLRSTWNVTMWNALTLREHLWHHRDVSKQIAVIRAGGSAAPPPDGLRVPGWGMPFDAVWKCGDAFVLDLTTDVAQQAEWLRRIRPHYLLTYPTNLKALLNSFVPGEMSVEQVISIGETVTADLRSRCREVFGARLFANYSSQEVGYIALECVDCGQYHIQSEAVLIEILDEEGQPCEPGRIGRVIVTDLHNQVMPLIRYEIGDYAEVGEPCSVGRTLPSLRRILGRERNMIVHPDGRRHWPLAGFARFRELAPIRQYQFVQRTLRDVEVRLVVDRPLLGAEEDALRTVIYRTLGAEFNLHLHQQPDRLSIKPGAKFEEFVCLIKGESA